MAQVLPGVTIALPFYNAEETLLDAVRSVFAQSHQQWELILIDDGSEDGSLDIARAINDERVRLYSDGKNQRLGARLNQVPDIARYDFIARMDADDLMSPYRIERLLKFLVENDQYDLVSSGTYSIGRNNSLRGLRGRQESSYSFEGLLSKSQEFLHAGLIAKKTWYQRNRYEESLAVGEDTLLWLVASSAGDFRAFSFADPLYMYREEGNVTKEKLLAAYYIERAYKAPLVSSSTKKMVYIIGSYVKAILVEVLSRVDKLEYLLDRRNPEIISEEARSEYLKECAIIFATEVPGIDYGRSTNHSM